MLFYPPEKLLYIPSSQIKFSYDVWGYVQIVCQKHKCLIL